jgi:hypothetical protein
MVSDPNVPLVARLRPLFETVPPTHPVATLAPLQVKEPVAVRFIPPTTIEDPDAVNVQLLGFSITVPLKVPPRNGREYE